MSDSRPPTLLCATGRLTMPKIARNLRQPLPTLAHVWSPIYQVGHPGPLLYIAYELNGWRAVNVGSGVDNGPAFHY